MKKISMLLIALLLLALPVFAQKIGYVDLQRALNLSKAGVAAKQQMTEQVQKYEGEFKTRQDDVLRMKADLEKQAALLSDSARTEREREYQRRVTDLQRFQQDIQEDLQRKDAEYTGRIINELFAVMEKLGAEGDYTMIIERNEGAIVYADPKFDLTAELIKAYDATK
ncbi:MAG: OmpH family outer membrane protein [Desulfuromonadales bacterium]|nr:OmpH family outer membrane protein [Desulfuromonadales bacterium]